VLTNPDWDAVPGLRHGFLDRGDSTMAGGGDWGRALGALGIALPPVTVRQVHGTRVVMADPAAEPTEADAIVTRERGLAVGIVTADCVPVLLLAPSVGAVAAVHAGWRGAAAGVLEAALRRVCETSDVTPAGVEVALGPSIGPCCYRVGVEVQAAFTARTGTTTAAAWTPAGDRLVLDLRGAARLLLEAAGVRSITAVGPCTRCTPTLASYRRDGADAGRQLSFIGWNGARTA
jgi:YfiH family protein